VKLRPYQQKLEQDGRTAITEGHRKIIMQLPTGGGKTVVFSSILKKAEAKQTDALLLTDRTELFTQAKRTLEFGDVSVSTIEPSPLRSCPLRVLWLLWLQRLGEG
jgi:superfamily II DNA or RNA helicase